MFKVMWLLKRKKGVSHEEFREHFERSHAAIAQKYVGHLLVEYTRNYTHEVWCGGDPSKEGSGYGPREWEWDLISEWVMPNEEAFKEVGRIMNQPDISKEFQTWYIDHDAVVMIPCAVVNSGPSASTGIQG